MTAKHLPASDWFALVAFLLMYQGVPGPRIGQQLTEPHLRPQWQARYDRGMTPAMAVAEHDKDSLYLMGLAKCDSPACDALLPLDTYRCPRCGSEQKPF